MTAWIAAGLVVVGAAFMLVAALGVARFPDVFTRMQASTKAGSLGLGCLMVAAALRFDQVGVTVQVLLIAALFIVTSPVAAQRIGRAAHRIGVPLAAQTQRDDLRESVAPGTEEVGIDPPAPDAPDPSVSSPPGPGPRGDGPAEG